MTGQYTEAEFFSKYDKAQWKSITLSEGTAVIQQRNTLNYYKRESDGSWTNYECRTVYKQRP